MDLLTQLIAAQPSLRWTTAQGRAEFLPYESEQDASATHAYAIPYMAGDTWIATRRGDGQWTLPGGTRVGAERWDETLERELLEETGCAIECYAPFGAFRVDAGPRRTHRIVCLAAVRRVQPRADPDGARGIVEVAETSIEEAVGLFAGGRVQYGAVYSIAGALMRDGRFVLSRKPGVPPSEAPC
jgi:8-oxo-dGTP pyrophosphatase MutT (NUDIX family)